MDDTASTSLNSTGIPDEVVPAGFMRRWAALLLDSLILGLPLALAILALGLATGGFNPMSEAGAEIFQLFYTLAYFLVAPFYFAGQESSRYQATLGKRALGIKVTDMDGRRIGIANAIGRWFAAFLSYLTLYIGFLMAAFTGRKRALHDYIAGTQVVDQWAYSEFPERQKRGLSGCVIALMMAMLCVPVVAIIAAIAISQYQDYVIRAQVSEASALATGVETAVAEYFDKHGDFPASNEAARLPPADMIEGAYVSRMDAGRFPGRIEATFSSTAPQRANLALNGTTIYFTATVADGRMSWRCDSETIPQKSCPTSCECRK